MKYSYLLIGLLTILIIAGCKKETKYKDAVYITGTETSAIKRVAVEAPSNIAAVSLSASTIVSEDITATFAPDPGLIDAFNKANNTQCLPLPEGSYKLTSTQSVIKKGFYVSEPVGVSITSLDDLKAGKTYLLPVTVTSVNGNLDILQASKTVYYIITKTIITQALDISPSNYLTPTFNTDANVAKLKDMKAITLEIRFMAKGWQPYSPYISTLMGTEEHFLLRFGDVGTPSNVLQFARGGTKLNSSTAFSTGVWYHVALTYDGTTLKMYVNGKQDALMNVAISPIDLTYAAGNNGVFMIGKSAGGRSFNGSISECRVWSRALSQSEIQAGMCDVDPTSAGLEAYWKMDAISGNRVSDKSPNGHDAILSGTAKWITNVKCPEN